MTNLDTKNQPFKSSEAINKTIVVLMQSNRLSPRLKLGEHALFETNELPALDCCVLTAIGNDLKIEIYNGTQTNIIGSEVARYMKKSDSIFSEVKKIKLS